MEEIREKQLSDGKEVFDTAVFCDDSWQKEVMPLSAVLSTPS